MAYCVPGSPDFCGNPLQTLNHFSFDGAEIAKLGGAPYEKDIHSRRREQILVQTVSLAYAPFEQIPLHRALEMAFGNAYDEPVRIFRAGGNALPAEAQMGSRAPVTAFHKGGDSQFPAEFL